MDFEIIGDLDDMVLRDGKEIPHAVGGKADDDRSQPSQQPSAADDGAHNQVLIVPQAGDTTSSSVNPANQGDTRDKRSPNFDLVPLAVGGAVALAADVFTEGAAAPSDAAIVTGVAEGIETLIGSTVIEEATVAEEIASELPVASLGLPIGPALSGLGPGTKGKPDPPSNLLNAVSDDGTSELVPRDAKRHLEHNPDHDTPDSGVFKHVKFGDNTIETTCTSATEITALEPIHGIAPDFISTGGAFAQLSPDLFYVNGHTVQVRSILNAITTQNATAAGISRSMDVFDHNAAPLEPATTRVHKVIFTNPLHKGFVSPADLAPLFNGNTPSSRYVASMLQPALRPASQSWLYAISGAIRDQLVFTDNRALYAKIITAALQQEIASYAGVAPIATAWPGDNLVTFINLDDANLDATTLLAQMQKGSFIFVQDEDWDSNDLLATHWLSASGHRMTSAAGTASLDAFYVDWPGIPVCILHHGAAVARPAAALCSAAKLYAFAEKMATYRHELDSLVAGMYIAMEAVGIRYYTVGAVHYPLTSNYNSCPTYMVAPGEYNFMLRIAQVYPKQSELIIPEADAFTALSPEGRVRLSAMYNAAIGAFTTTVLYACSIQTINIVHWCSGADPEAFANTILAEGFCQPPQTEYRECIPYFIPKLAIRQYMGFTPMINLYPGSPWNGAQNSNANAAHSFNPHANDQTPRLYSLLSIDNFLLERPQEWAVLGPHTKANLIHELRALGATAVKLGLFSHLGSSQYMANLTGGLPYKFVPYGNQVVNLVHQYFAFAAISVRYNACGYQYGLKGDWDAPANYDNAMYDADLHIVQPCTLQSYDYGDNEVRAPCMNGDCLTADQRRRLSMFSGGPVDYVGFALRRSPTDTLSPLQTVPIMAFKALSMFGNKSKGSITQSKDESGSASANPENPH